MAVTWPDVPKAHDFDAAADHLSPITNPMR